LAVGEKWKTLSVNIEKITISWETFIACQIIVTSSREKAGDPSVG